LDAADNFEPGAFFDAADDIVGIDASHWHAVTDNGADQIGRSADHDRFKIQSVFLKDFFLLCNKDGPTR
jgi:hypothetical protein